MVRRVRVAVVSGIVGTLLAGCTVGAGAVERRELVDASPLAEFLGTPPRGQLGLPHLDERERQRQDRYAELVAGCMTDAGFDYRAVSMRDRLGQDFLDAYALSPAEFAQRYGYGVTTIELPRFTDPNQEIRAGLGEGRQQEYDLRLWGGPAGDGGCHQQASTEVYGDPADREAQFGEFAGLLAGINALYQRIDDDPRLREAHRHWAACMADAGHEGLRVPADARRSVFDRLPTDSPGTPPDPAAVPDLAGQVPPEALAEVRRYELALATTDLDCRRRHVDGVRRLVTIEQESEFVAAYREELLRYRDQLTG